MHPAAADQIRNEEAGMRNRFWLDKSEYDTLDKSEYDTKICSLFLIPNSYFLIANCHGIFNRIRRLLW
jgi:hypothetical protein